MRVASSDTVLKEWFYRATYFEGCWVSRSRATSTELKVPLLKTHEPSSRLKPQVLIRWLGAPCLQGKALH